MKHARLVDSLAMALVIGMTAVVAARFAGPPAYDLSWHTVDGGGGTASGGGFQLSGTIGQTDAGAALSGGPFTLVGGFWLADGPTPSTCPPDIAPLPNGNNAVDVDDLLAVINGWGMCSAPPSTCAADIAPVGGNGVINVDDLLMVINGWGPCE